MKLKGKFKDKFDFFLIFTEYEELSISDYIDLGLAPKGTATDKFSKIYFKDKDVQLNLKRYKIDPLDIKIEKVSFKEWYDNYEDSENSYFYDFISEEYRGKPQASVYIDGFDKSDNNLDVFDDLYDPEILDYIKKTRGLENINKMNFKSKMMKEAFKKNKYRETDTSEIISDLIDLENVDTDEEKGKFKELITGLIFSEDDKAKKFLKAINDFTSGLDKEDF